MTAGEDFGIHNTDTRRTAMNELIDPHQCGAMAPFHLQAPITITPRQMNARLFGSGTMYALKTAEAPAVVRWNAPCVVLKVLPGKIIEVPDNGPMPVLKSYVANAVLTISSTSEFVVKSAIPAPLLVGVSKTATLSMKVAGPRPGTVTTAVPRSWLTLQIPDGRRSPYRQ